MEIKIKVPDEVLEFFKKHGSVAMMGSKEMDETWFYFPFWLLQKGDDPVKIVSFDQLPQHLKDFIEKHRNAFTKRLIDKDGNELES